jgi:hypothetical protein
MFNSTLKSQMMIRLGNIIMGAAKYSRRVVAPLALFYTHGLGIANLQVLTI